MGSIYTVSFLWITASWLALLFYQMTIKMDPGSLVPESWLISNGSRRGERCFGRCGCWLVSGFGPLRTRCWDPRKPCLEDAHNSCYLPRHTLAFLFEPTDIWLSELTVLRSNFWNLLWFSLPKPNLFIILTLFSNSDSQNLFKILGVWFCFHPPKTVQTKGLLLGLRWLGQRLALLHWQSGKQCKATCPSSPTATNSSSEKQFTHSCQAPNYPETLNKQVENKCKIQMTLHWIIKRKWNRP